MKAIQITAPSEMKVVDIEKPVLEPGEGKHSASCVFLSKL